MKHWLKVRQRYLISPGHAKLAQANTVLFMGIPKEYLDEGQLAELFSSLPGGVKRIWLNRSVDCIPRCSGSLTSKQSERYAGSVGAPDESLP